MSLARRTSAIALAAAAVSLLTVGLARSLSLGPSSLAEAAPPHHGSGAGRDEAAVGLSDGAYALELAPPVVQVGTRGLAFIIRDLRSGAPLLRYDDDLTKKLHLIVVRADTTGFQHVHPRLQADGRWLVTDALFDRAGPWRLIADFIPGGGERTVLATNLHVVGGRYTARGFVESERVGRTAWRAASGAYTVVAEAGSYAAGADGKLRFQISRLGRPVVDLQPYLGALGHCVLLRAGDLGYTHVQPSEAPKAGPTIEFETRYPGGAPLAVFLQFRHRGAVQTVTFHLPAPPARA